MYDNIITIAWLSWDHNLKDKDKGIKAKKRQKGKKHKKSHQTLDVHSFLFQFHSIFHRKFFEFCPTSINMQPQNTLSESLDFYHYPVGTTSLSDVGTYGFLQPSYDYQAASRSFCNSSFNSLEMSGITDSTPEARAVAASHQHKEAERRRRERINSHLDRLRTLLPCSSKVLLIYCTFLCFD